MSGKKSKTIDPANLDPDEKLKYEVAEEIGLLDKGDDGRLEITYIKGDRQDRRISDTKEEAAIRRAEYFFTKIDKFDRIIHPRETTGDVYERKNKCFEYGNGLHNSEGSDVKSDCVSGKRVG